VHGAKPDYTSHSSGSPACPLTRLLCLNVIESVNNSNNWRNSPNFANQAFRQWHVLLAEDLLADTVPFLPLHLLCTTQFVCFGLLVVDLSEVFGRQTTN
jgi:hypothetical protein